MTGTRLKSKISAIAVLLGTAAVHFSVAAPSLDERPAYVEAVTALRDNDPDTAAEKLTQLIEAAEDLDPVSAAQIRQLHLEALVRSGDIGSALTAASNPKLGDAPEAAFWRGIALARAHRHEEAVTHFEAVKKASSNGFAHPYELWLNLAISYHQSGNSEAAIAALGPLLTAEAPASYRERGTQLVARIEMERERFDAALSWLKRPISALDDEEAAQQERALLRGQIALRQSDLDASKTIFDSIARKAVGTPRGDRAILHLASVAVASDQTGKATGLLLDFIESKPNSPLLIPAFQRLGKSKLLTSSDSIRSLQTWAADETQPKRAALSHFFRGVSARDKDDYESALAALGRFLNDFPNHPLREEAQVQEAETLITTERLDEAAAAIASLKTSAQLPSTRENLTHLQARFDAAQGLAQESIDLFRSTMDSGPDEDSRMVATFNGALASVLSGDEETYESLFASLARSSKNSLLSGDLTLERGLYEAKNSEAGAFENLENFVRQFPDHPRAPDAEIALAELYLSQVPAQPVPARDHLDAAQRKELTLDQREWLDYVAIWVEIAAQEKTPAVIERARRFLDEWPQSARRPFVFQVLGENDFQNGNYADAITHFEGLRAEAPDSPFAEAALFFAAKSASRLLDTENQDRAWNLWNEIAESSGPLAPAARHEQGLLRLSQEQFDEAALAFESAASMPNADPQLVIAALADKGEALYAKAAVLKIASPETLEAAIAAFSSVADQEEVSKSWRLQTTVRQGKCLEALGKTEEALALYFSVIENGAPAGPVAAVPTSEFDWFYRAGLAAIRLLQAEENWEMSVAVADRIAQFSGPRAAEADGIADRLRLRHFIWQEPGK